MKYLAKGNHYSFAETEGWHELVKKNILKEAVVTFKPSGTQGTKGLFLAHPRQASLGAQMVGNTPANSGDVGMSPGWGRSPGEGSGNPLQSSCLENPMDRGAWRATVHGVAKSQTWVSNEHLHPRQSLWVLRGSAWCHLHPVAQPLSEVLEVSILATAPTGLN